ncbi:MAG: anthranilate phosphoribosyltransferase [Flavobacteriaceae bacterium]|nr:anthranilate phosphoribosyltransferase [Bacteroidia bacterium]NNK87110.1 anthranilate phosphoribosyltransferase [Flavobacteriaceae bacterium]
MKELLNRLINYESISSQEARDVLVRISNGEFNQSQIASFLTVYMMRSITLEELKGFREALLELCIPIDLSDFGAIDLCGTGGDGKDTFNISTLSSFVTAGAGIKVAKHGNYGVSSACGSSNVLEYLGVAFSSDEDYLKNCIDKAGICILHAPLFHPAMKNVAPIRRELGVKTFFNMLGPMVNPAFPKHQMVGVFNLELLRLYGYLYQETDMNYAIVHALDGYDEISLTGDTKVISNRSEQIFSPEAINLKAVEKTEIFGGGSVREAADIFMNVIEGKGTEAQNNVVCANAGLAIATAGQTKHLVGIEQARESLLTGKAAEALKTLIDLNS